MALLKRIADLIPPVVLAIITLAATPNNTSDATPLQTLFMIKQLLPQTKTVGLMWEQSDVDYGGIIPQINRAAAAVGVKVVVEDVEQMKDVAERFRDLTQKYHIQALWIFGNADILASSIAEGFLIKNSTMNSVPLFAPNSNWVSAGACAAVVSNGSDAELIVNQKTISVLGMKVPSKYISITQFLATN